MTTKTGNVYFLGVSRPEDRGVLVRKVKRLSKEELSAALLTLQSQNGRSATFDDGLVVVGDTVEVLQEVRMEAEPLLLVVDGETATVSKGVQVPIVQNAVSPYGTTTVQSVTYKPTGLQVSVTMRDLGNGQGLMKLHFSLDDIVGTAIQGYPNLANQSLDTLVAVRSGGLYLVGALTRNDNSHTLTGGIDWHAADSAEGQVLQVWARVYRVGGTCPTK